MRRATLALVCALSSLTTLSPPARAELGGKQMNGIGLIDYSRKPDLKAGQWVQYHVTGNSVTGAEDDYVITVAIPGMERFWGEDCFWVETKTEYKNAGTYAVATLMSFDIFNDSDPVRNLQMFQRKFISSFNPDGTPQVTVTKRPPESLRLRNKTRGGAQVYFDTLGTDTVRVPSGLFDVRKLRIRQGASSATDRGDSTQYEEMYETRVDYLSPKVPVTGLAREDIDYLYQAKAWLIGRSNSGDLMTKEHSVGRAELTAQGTDYESTILLPDWQRDRRPTEGTRPTTTRHPTTTKKK